MIDYKELFSNPIVRNVLCLVVGVAIGAVFYPSKNIEEKYERQYKQKLEEEMRTQSEINSKQISQLKEEFAKTSSELKKEKREAESKVTQLSETVKNLQSKQKTAYYKLIKPDGTIEIKKFSESEVNESTRVVTQIQQEFKEKVESIEQKWETVHKKRVQDLTVEYRSKEQTYQKKISELEEQVKYSKKTEINPKKYGISGGYMSGDTYYVSGEADVFGPVYLEVQGQTGKNNAIGAGIGLRF
jgi:uncharacterized membrane-anchored protein YhcB (DUF1043 family)